MDKWYKLKVMVRAATGEDPTDSNCEDIVDYIYDKLTANLADRIIEENGLDQVIWTIMQCLDGKGYNEEESED